MPQLIQTDSLHLIIGMGSTGLSIATYLCAKGVRVAVMDTRDNPPNQAAFAALTLEHCHLGGLSEALLGQASVIYPSPGVAVNTPVIQQALNQGARLSSDIELFLQDFDRAVVAITGSNGKSTVTTLVGEMAKAAGWRVGVGGNIGTPALACLQVHQQTPLDLMVLELSSFQLELLERVPATVVTLLNVTPDHLDRYPSFEAYFLAKHRIFRGAKAVVMNAEDPKTQPLVPSSVPVQAYRLGEPDLNEWGLRQQGEAWYFAKGLETKWPVASMKVQGRHQWHNALAAIALAEQVGIAETAIEQALLNFSGLEHRCEWVADVKGVRYFNDSKGTNSGATLAAIEGLGPLCPGRLLWIAGGLAKETDFEVLRASVERWVSQAWFLGTSKTLLFESFPKTHSVLVEQLQQAVHAASEQAQAGDWVLFSPAAASFDQFDHFEHRGQVFKDLVQALASAAQSASQ
jgi:UDP-N-acetylmuramoylalanine--D-glutamate ligase